MEWSQFQSLTWPALIPNGFSARDITRRYDISGLAGGSEQRQHQVERMRSEWINAPVVEAFDGKKVTLTGFIVPLDDGALKFGEFLLVPFAGACIHVPPPPSNQIIYVKLSERLYVEDLDQPYRVAGIMRTLSNNTDLASSGYTLEALAVEVDPRY
ncbi:DUF3299 domain-containing protein [Aestuariirhabdus sp. Z084]|uniref:DUF3299 domain-containing protein n=1 Tax=Aestuariirhabdus haliotis TaxID=2918751 RepID=UPI00201B3F7D|nr:DUF3299 domain-containing protein [Aestuariirhabdus haliotis]MCL6415138.1 DUF3299 domain-containing protein [Aestuariirhabdus haliotis]MCL6419070.1 DUF3299 domain-containing protein [Aestuariirhabdus haliotis]